MSGYRSCFYILIFVLLLGLSTRSQGQELLLSTTGGMARFIAVAENDAFKWGKTGSVVVAAKIANQIYAGAKVSYSSFTGDTADLRSLFPGLRLDVDLTVLEFSPVVRLLASEKSRKLLLFMQAGYGFFRYEIAGSSSNFADVGGLGFATGLITNYDSPVNLEIAPTINFTFNDKDAQNFVMLDIGFVFRNK